MPPFTSGSLPWELPRAPGSIGIVALLVLVLLGRWLPHPPNFTPVGAVALYLGACYRPFGAILVTLLALLLSDLLLGFYHPVTLIAVYLGTLLSVPCGLPLRRNCNVLCAVTSVLGASGLFFLVSNSGVWLSGELYPRDAAGYTRCLFLALPFYVSTLAAYACYTPLLFAVHRMLSRPGFPRASRWHVAGGSGHLG